MKAYCIHIKSPAYRNDQDPFVVMPHQDEGGDVQITLDENEAKGQLESLRRENPRSVYTLISFEVPA